MSNHHHKFSPSQLAAFEKCPRFVKEDSEDSEAARMGTLCHSAIEQGRPEMIVDEDLRAHVLTCMKFAQDLKAAYPNATVTNEQKLAGTYNQGTADICLIAPEQRLAIVTDWKMGQMAVEHPSRNIQLWAYALQIFEMYAEVDECILYVLQPKLSPEPMTAVRLRRDNGEIMTRIERIIAAVEDPTSEPTPDPGTCLWCGAKATCPAIQRHVNMVLQRGVGLAIPDNYTLGVNCTALNVAQRHIICTVLEGYIEQAKKVHAQWMIEHPSEAVPGFRLQTRQGNWKVIDQPLLVGQLQARGMSMDEVLACAKVSPKQAVETLASSNSMLDAAQVMEELRNAGAVERGATSQFLVKTYKTTEVEQLKGLLQ